MDYGTCTKAFVRRLEFDRMTMYIISMFHVGHYKYEVKMILKAMKQRLLRRHTRMLFQQALELCPRYAAIQKVSPEVHPEDFIFHFVIENTVFESLDQAVAYYFDDGARSASQLRTILQHICGWGGEGIKLLEFASGYGCVTRHMRNVLPEVSVTSCDIHQEAMDFISGTLGGNTVLSASVPEHLRVPDEYDVVFALSFFSHMPKTTWTRWMNSLLSKVKRGGFLIFTTHGWLSRQYIGFQDLDEEGFWFVPHSEQKDLDTAEYGVTATSPFFVINQIDKHSDGRLVCFREGHWWTHQDVYVIRRELT